MFSSCCVIAKRDGHSAAMGNTMIKAAVLSVLVSVGAPAFAQGQQQFNIPGQDLASSLNQLAMSADRQIVFAPQLVKGLKAPALAGAYTLEEALRKLLEPAGLKAEYLDDKTVAVRSASESDSHESRTTRAGQENSYLRLAQNSFSSQADASPAGASPSGDPEGRGGESESSSRATLEEVIVTARKTRERLQDVPVSVTAITGEQLRDRGAVDIKDVLGSIPGLAFSNVERGLSRYNIRGISSNVDAATVGVFLDDISLVQGSNTFNGAFDAVLFDIERVEVLKGPQGTLYGGSAMGGAIKYVSARPNLSQQSSSVAAGVGTTAHGSESYNAEGVLNLPIISDVLAVRGGFSYRREGGFIDNVADGTIEDTAYSSTPAPTYTPLVLPSLSSLNREDYNSADTYVARLSLLWQPDPSWSIRPAVFYQDYEQDSSGQFHTNENDLTASFRFPQATRDRGGIYSLDITKEMGAVEVTSLTGYSDRTVDWQRDYSFFIGGLVPSLYGFDGRALYRTETQTFSQELRVASATGPDTQLRWLGGVFYSTQDRHFPSSVYLYGPGFGALFGLDPDIVYFEDTTNKVDQYAAFGEATYAITQALDITAGVRLFKIEQTTDQTQDGLFADGFHHVLSDIKEDGVNPKVGLSYKVDASHLLYVSATKGFRPGGAITNANPPGCAGDLARLGYSSFPEQFDSDSLWSYELGSKNEFDNGRWVVNGALFYSDWKDIQQLVGLPNCGGAFTVNAGTASVKGAELEARINLTPALQIGGNATFTDAKLTEAVFGTPAHDDDQIQAVPEWMASAYGSYSIPLAATWDLRIRADYQYRGRQRNLYDRTQPVRFILPDGTYPALPNGSAPVAAEFQQSFDLLNASVYLEHGPTTFRMYVNNVLDERPFLDTDLYFGSSKSTTVRPRTIGLEFRRRF